MQPTPDIWVMQSGEADEPDRFPRLGRWQGKPGWISVGFREIKHDLTGWTRRQLRTAADLEYGTKVGGQTPKSREKGKELVNFFYDMKPGHLVAVRDVDCYRFAVIEGDPEHVPSARKPEKDHERRRSVRWLKVTVPFKDLSTALTCPRTIRPVTDRNYARQVLEAIGWDDERGLEGMEFEEQPVVASYDVTRENGTGVVLGVLADAVKDDLVPTETVMRSDDRSASTAARNLHNATQNALLAVLRRAEMTVLRPVAAPHYDLLIAGEAGLGVIEVKSVDGDNDDDQIRFGLGQLIDYMDRLEQTDRDVRGILWTSQKPADADRWARLLDAYNITLGWPGEEESTFGLA